MINGLPRYKELSACKNGANCIPKDCNTYTFAKNIQVFESVKLRIE